MIEELQDKSIKTDSLLPLYYQLKEILLDYMRDKEPHTSLPSENELCAHFGISRPTVRQTMLELAREGHIYRRRGMGSFVAERKIDRDFVMWRSNFNNDVRKKGAVPLTKVLKFGIREVSEKVRKALQVSHSEQIILLQRQRFVNAEPILLLDSYMPLSRLEGFLDINFSNRSLHTTFREVYGYQIDHTRRVLEAKGAPEQIASHLGIEAGNAVQYFENTVFLDDQSVIEYSEGWYRGDRIRFTFEYKRSEEGTDRQGGSSVWEE